MKNISIILLLGLFLLTACTSSIDLENEKAIYTQDSTSILSLEQAVGQAKQFIDSVRNLYNVPGLDVAVYLDSQIVFSKAAGYADIENDIPIKTGVTQFRIGSLSKIVTAAGLAKLVEEGKIDLDAEVQIYVPYFPKKAYPITIRHLATHTAGIRHYKGLEFITIDEYYPTVKSAVEIFKDDELEFKPGTEYLYSSYGINLISAAMEGATGKDFLSYMQQDILPELGMLSTCPDINDSTITNRTKYYEFGRNQKITRAGYSDVSYKWAGGGFLSTTHDLIKLGVAHLDTGFIKTQTLQEFTTPHTNIDDERKKGIVWTVFFDAFGHNGSAIGGRGRFRVYPESKMVVVVLANHTEPNPISEMFGVKEPDYNKVINKIANFFLRAR